MNKFRYYSNGLILIEVAIAMIIFSVCIGGVLMLMQHSQHTQQTITTLEHRKAVLHALNRYHRQHNQIPCPSQPVLDDGFALERCHGATEQIGLVPYKTLGLTASVAKDGYGRYFTYAVSETNTISDSALKANTTKNGLIILDSLDRQYGKPNEIACILIGHGKHGSGAFSLQADRKRFPTRTTFEAKNAHDTLTFYTDVPLKDSEHEVSFIHHADLDAPTKTAEPQTTAAAISAPSEDDPYGIESTEVDP